jgi:hypothetical protein
VYRGTAYTVRARGIKPSSALQPRTTIVRSNQRRAPIAERVEKAVSVVPDPFGRRPPLDHPHGGPVWAPVSSLGTETE